MKGRNSAVKVTLVLRDDHAMLRNLVASFNKVRARRKTRKKAVIMNSIQPHLHSAIESDAVRLAPPVMPERTDETKSGTPRPRQEVASLITELQTISGFEPHFELNVKSSLNNDIGRVGPLDVAPPDPEDLFDRMRRIFFEIPPASPTTFPRRGAASSPQGEI